MVSWIVVGSALFSNTHSDNLLLGQAGKEFHVDQRGGNTLQSAELRVNAKGEQHQEE